MEVYGITFTLWTIVKAALILWLFSVLYDWLAELAWRRKFGLKGRFPFPIVGTLPYIFWKLHLSNVPSAPNPMMISTSNYLPSLRGIFMTRDELDKESLDKYGSLYAASVGKMKVIAVSDIALLKKILIKEHVQFQNRYTMDLFNPWPMSKTLTSLKDEQWKRVRSVVSPTFSAGKLKKMTKEMNYCAELLTSGLMEKTKSGESIDSRKHFGCYTMDVIASTAFGVRTDSFNNPDDNFVSLAQKVFGTDTMNPMVLLACFVSFLVKVFGISVYYPLDSLAFFVDVIKKLIKERQEKGDTERTDMLQLMLNAELQEETEDGAQSVKKLSQDELIGMGVIAFVAGYETTASLLTFLSYVLATHPDVQEKLLAEIDEHFPAGTAEIKYDVVMEMSYLDQVINETLRMYPPVTNMNRTTSNDKDVEVDGHWFPRDTVIMYSVWLLHRNKNLYPEPEEFRPERFTSEEKAKRDPFTFIPFGHGPRNCIGMRLASLEAKIATVAVLRKMKFVKCADTEEKLQLNRDSFLRPKNPIKVGVVLR